MSRKRHILRMAGVKRQTKRLVITATITEYPNDAQGKPVKPDVHLNLDNPNGLGLMDARAMLQRVLRDVEDKIAVQQGAERHEGLRMLDGVNVMKPGSLRPKGVNDGPTTMPAVRPTDTPPAVIGAAGDTDLRPVLAGDTAG